MSSLRVHKHFKHTSNILRNILQIPFITGYDSGLYQNSNIISGSYIPEFVRDVLVKVISGTRIEVSWMHHLSIIESLNIIYA